MASQGRKRKHPGRVAAPLAGEALARAILALPPQPQPICCRVEGCLEPLVPGYHKKYKICLSHSKADELCIEGRTCRWCQQCGRFHGLDVFDARLRSCRHSLARHQQRRKRRQAHLGAGAHKSQPAQSDSTEEVEQAPAGEQQQQSQLGGSECEAQPQPEPAAPPPTVPPALSEQAATHRPREPANSAKQPRPRQPAGSMQSGAPATEEQPSAEQPSLPAAQRLSEPHCAKRARLSPAPEAPPAPAPAPAPAPNAQQARQARQTGPPPPVTPPGQPGGQAACSLLMSEAASPMRSRSHAVPAQQALWPLLQQAAAAPAPADATWGQQALPSPSAAAWGCQPVPSSPCAAAWGQQASGAPDEAAWGQQPPASPSAAAWGYQLVPASASAVAWGCQPVPASPSAAAWVQQAPGAPAEAAWGQQPTSASAVAWAVAPAEAAWGRQLPGASPATATWGQQPTEGSWLLIVGDQRLAPVQQPQMHQPSVLPAAACEMQQPAGQVFWPAQQAQQAQHARRARSASGGCSGSASYYPRLEPAAVQQRHMHSPVATEAFHCSPFVEVAACSASMPAALLSPLMGTAPHSLPPSTSATASAYTTAASLTPTYGGSIIHPRYSPFHGGCAEAMPVSPAFWPGAGLPAAPATAQPPPLQPPPAQLQPASLPPEGYNGSSSALNQACGQLGWLDEQQQLAPGAVATPRAAALLRSPLPSQRAELPFSLQPSQLPSPRATVQSSMAVHQLPSPRRAELPPSLLPGPHAELSFDLLPARLPSLALPQAPPAQQAQQAQQSQRGWEADWEECLDLSPLSCPPSPAISWLAGFS